MANNKYYLVSLQTQQHEGPVYVGCESPNPKVTQPNKWFITDDPERACGLPTQGWARDFTAQLNQGGEAYGLVNDGHVWHVCSEDKKVFKAI
jgi:hypothetical protein